MLLHYLGKLKIQILKSLKVGTFLRHNVVVVFLVMMMVLTVIAIAAADLVV